MAGLTYDTAALIAADRDEQRMWAIHRRALERGHAPTVPAAVLVEGWRGGASTARLLLGCQVEPLDATAARASGSLLGRAPAGPSAVDATVVEGALRRGDAVVSSDPQDLTRLAGGIGRRVDVIPV